MENCFQSLMKYLIFIGNFIVLLSGALLIASGAYTIGQEESYVQFFLESDDTISQLAVGVILIVVGVLVVLMGFFGCCGAVTENACMMFAFATMLAIVFLIEVGVCIAYFVAKPSADVESLFKEKMLNGLNAYNSGPDADVVTEMINSMQSDLKCCGVEEYKDWSGTPFGNGANVPDTCCIDATAGCGEGILTNTDIDVSTKIYEKGCLTKAVSSVESVKDIVLGVGIGIGVLQVLGVLVSCMLAADMRKKANYV